MITAGTVRDTLRNCSASNWYRNFLNLKPQPLRCVYIYIYMYTHQILWDSIESKAVYMKKWYFPKMGGTRYKHQKNTILIIGTTKKVEPLHEPRHRRGNILVLQCPGEHQASRADQKTFGGLRIPVQGLWRLTGLGS